MVNNINKELFDKKIHNIYENDWIGKSNSDRCNFKVLVTLLDIFVTRICRYSISCEITHAHLLKSTR